MGSDGSTWERWRLIAPRQSRDPGARESYWKSDRWPRVSVPAHKRFLARLSRHALTRRAICGGATQGTLRHGGRLCRSVRKPMGPGRTGDIAVTEEPPIGMADEQSEFWSKVAEKYDQVVDLQIGPNTRPMVRERLAQEGRLGTLAEFGCGTGYYTPVLADRADTVVATDISAGMLALARSQIKAANVTFQTEDI